MNSRERVIRSLYLEIPDRVPWIEGYVHRELVEKILKEEMKIPNFVRVCPEISHFLGLDNITIDMRPPIFAEQNFFSDGIPYLGKGLLNDWKDIEKIKLPNLEDGKLFNDIKNYLKKYKKDKCAMLSMRAGPANTYLSMGIESFSLKLYDDINFIEFVMDIFTEWCCKVASNAKYLGFDIVRMGEDWAFKSGSFFSKKILNKLFLPRLEKVVNLLEIPWIYHSDGNFMEYLNDILALKSKPSGIANLEPNSMDIDFIKDNYGKRVCLIGNISLNTLSIGSVNDTIDEVTKRIRKIGLGGGYILSSENGLTRYCKPENIIAMSDTVNQYQHT